MTRVFLVIDSVMPDGIHIRSAHSNLESALIAARDLAQGFELITSENPEWLVQWKNVKRNIFVIKMPVTQ